MHKFRTVCFDTVPFFEEMLMNQIWIVKDKDVYQFVHNVLIYVCVLEICVVILHTFYVECDKHLCIKLDQSRVVRGKQIRCISVVLDNRGDKSVNIAIFCGETTGTKTGDKSVNIAMFYL